MQISRRTALRLGGAALAARLTDPAHAAEPVVATTYPGSFDEAFKAVVGPAFAKATGASVNFTPLLNVDQIGKIQAARANPPFDVVLFDEGPLINAKVRRHPGTTSGSPNTRAVSALPAWPLVLAPPSWWTWR